MAGSYVSDPQAREIGTIFKFMDTDGDGLLSIQHAIKLCERLGFHVDRSTLQHREEGVSLRELLTWCDKFVGACTRSADLHLTQMFTLLQRDGFIAPEAMRQYLADEQYSFSPHLVNALVEHIGDEGGRVNCEQFKAFMRQEVLSATREEAHADSYQRGFPWMGASTSSDGRMKGRLPRDGTRSESVMGRVRIEQHLAYS